MTMLALEFSTAQRSAAVLRVAEALPDAVAGGRPAGGVSPLTLPPQATLSEAVESGGRATHAFALVAAALRQAGVEREQIACLVLGLGPGSYTGIRAAIGVAQGWSLGCEVKLLGGSSAEAIAAEAYASGRRGPVSVVIDAQRGEFYLAGYELTDAGWRAAEPLRLATRAEMEARVGDGACLIGPELGRWFPAAEVVFPRAATLARLALGRCDFVSGERLEPLYLRPVQFVKAAAPRALPE